MNIAKESVIFAPFLKMMEFNKFYKYLFKILFYFRTFINSGIMIYN